MFTVFSLLGGKKNASQMVFFFGKENMGKDKQNGLISWITLIALVEFQPQGPKKRGKNPQTPKYFGMTSPKVTIYFFNYFSFLFL